MMTARVTDRLICVSPSRVGQLWHVAEPMISAAYAEVDELMPADMLAALKRGDLLLWVSAPDGTIVMALVTALVPKPSGLACKLMACGGSDMALWIGEHPQIEAYARAEGCVKLLAEGRQGWAKALSAAGYSCKRVVLEKRL